LVPTCEGGPAQGRHLKAILSLDHGTGLQQKPHCLCMAWEIGKKSENNMAVGCSEKMVVYVLKKKSFLLDDFLGGDRIENDVSSACLMSILVVFDLFLYV